MLKLTKAKNLNEHKFNKKHLKKLGVTTITVATVGTATIPNIASAESVESVEPTVVTSQYDDAYVNDSNIVLDETAKLWLMKNFDSLGIQKQTQVSLIEKIESGQLLDSENPEMQGTGVTTEKEYTNSDGYKCKEVRTTYPDGSVTLSNVTGDGKDAPSIDATRVTGGSTSTSGKKTTYKGATVKQNHATYTVSFKADYTIDKNNGGKDYISSVYSPSVSSFGTLTAPTLKIDRQKESSNGPAHASLVCTRSVGPSMIQYSGTIYMDFFVGGNKAWDTGKFR